MKKEKKGHMTLDDRHVISHGISIKKGKKFAIFL
jgi:hypothetical protein